MGALENSDYYYIIIIIIIVSLHTPQVRAVVAGDGYVCNLIIVIVVMVLVIVIITALSYRHYIPVIIYPHCYC